MEVDLIIKNASELLTLQGTDQPARDEFLGALGVIENGSVAIKDDTIIEIGKEEEISEEYEGKEINARNNVVMPGFIDAHTHLVFAGARENELSLKIRGISYKAIAERGGGIQKTVQMTREASKEELVQQAEKRLDEMLKYGTTTIEAKSGYGLNVEDEIKMLEVIQELDQAHPIDIIPTFLGAHEIPKEYKEEPEEYVKKITEEMIPTVSENNLAKFCDVFVEDGVFSIKQARQIFNVGKEYGLIPRVHADELTQLGGAELAAEIGAISASHLLHASEQGVTNMREQNVIGIYLPAACMTLMSENFPNLRKIIDSGLPIALATDLNPNCWLTNMQTVLMLGIYFMRITPAEAVTAATLNPAYSLGIQEKVGSIEKGKNADMIILDVPTHRWLGYKMGTNLVNTVIKDGKIVWDRIRDS